MATSAFTTERDILQAYCGDRSSATQTYIDYIVNEAYQELADALDWPWLKYSGTVNLQGTYTAGTISAAAGDPTITGDSTVWTGLTATGLELEAAPEVYGVSTLTDNTHLEADRNVVTAIAAGTTYTILRRKYSLTARMRGTPVFRVSGSPQAMPLQIVSREQMETMAQPPFVYDRPSTVCFIEDDSSNQQQVMVWPVPSVAATLHYAGFRQVVDLSGSTGFLFPTELLPVFRELARAKLWHWRKDPVRESAAMQKYLMGLEKAVRQAAPDTGRGDELPLDPARFPPSPYGERNIVTISPSE